MNFFEKLDYSNAKSFNEIWEDPKYQTKLFLGNMQSASRIDELKKKRNNSSIDNSKRIVHKISPLRYTISPDNTYR